MESARNPKNPGAPEAETPGTSPVKLHVATPTPDASGLDFLLDIPLRISVELGRAKLLVQDLLKLHKGSVIELTKLAGEPLEVLVNDRVVARGEVIVVNEKFGVRLTDIVSHAQRIRNLGE
jgi:flagellar motor switch protein FliN/FliY